TPIEIRSSCQVAIANSRGSRTGSDHLMPGFQRLSGRLPTFLAPTTFSCQRLVGSATAGLSRFCHGARALCRRHRVARRRLPPRRGLVTLRAMSRLLPLLLAAIVLSLPACGFHLREPLRLPPDLAGVQVV